MRLDITPLAEGDRQTILYDGDTNEIFHYAPFKCFSVADLEQALGPELADIFPKNGGFYLKFGIGSLWRYVEKLNLPDDDPSFKSEHTIHSFLPLENNSTILSRLSYNATREFEDELDFFMLDPANVNTLSMVRIGTRGVLRIIDTPNELRQPREDIERVFQLPRGYGCSRRTAANNNHDRVVQPKRLEFMGLDAGDLRLLRLDVVASRPVETTGSSAGLGRCDNHDRWRSHSSSVRILSGGYRVAGYERNYMIFDIQESASQRGSLVKYLAGVMSSRRSGVQRTKVVWDMSNLGSDTRSRYFKLDSSEGKCLGYGETKSPLGVGADLHVSPASSDFEQDSPPLMVALGIELLASLFSPEDYHLIARTIKRNRKEELVFEKRQESFEMKNLQGQVVWEGPVSFIRQYVVSMARDDDQSHEAPWRCRRRRRFVVMANGQAQL